MLIEQIDTRVLGAMKLVDSATNTKIVRPLRLHSNTASVVRNARGYYVITDVQGLASHIGEFEEAPTTPTLGSINCTFEINDPQQRYLPQLVTMALPRDPDPQHSENDDSLFKTRDVILYPASTAKLSHNWSTVRVSVSQGSSEDPVAGCLIQVFDTEDDSLLGTGISDPRGEALVVIPGIPVTQFSDAVDSGTGGGHGGGHGGGGGGSSPVVVNTLDARLELSYVAGTKWPVNPEQLVAQHAANIQQTQTLTLSTGSMARASINLS